MSGPISRRSGQNKSGYGLYADGMMELDWEVGEILKKIDDLGIADNTIVVFTSDNGAETFSVGPTAATTRSAAKRALPMKAVSVCRWL